MFCTSCGARLDAGARFCLACGARQTPVKAGVSGGVAPAPPAPKKKGGAGRVIAITAAVFAGLALILLGAYFTLTGLMRVVTFREPSLPPSERRPEGEYADYESLIEDYFWMFERRDSAFFQNFLHESAIDILKRDQIPESEYAEHVDVWYSYYGSAVSRYEIIDVYPYANSDYGQLTDIFGLGQGDVEQYVSVSVDVGLGGEDAPEELTVDFDLIKVAGHWYLVEVW